LTLLSKKETGDWTLIQMALSLDPIEEKEEEGDQDLETDSSICFEFYLQVFQESEVDFFVEEVFRHFEVFLVLSLILLVLLLRRLQLLGHSWVSPLHDVLQ
jgi:hypothetical protein